MNLMRARCENGVKRRIPPSAEEPQPRADDHLWARVFLALLLRPVVQHAVELAEHLGGEFGKGDPLDGLGHGQRCAGGRPRKVSTVESSCCGMAGSFGYEAEHHQASMQMAELALLPAIRKRAPSTVVVADGTSCRHQIHDGAEVNAVHTARLLAQALT